MQKRFFVIVYLLTFLLTNSNACVLDSMETASLKELNQQLFDAVLANKPSKVKKLLKDGAELTCYRTYDYTAEHNHWAWELHRGAYRRFAEDYYVPPFIAAVLEENEQMVTMLLEYGADIEIRSNPWHYNETALHKAARMCSIPMVTLLLNHGANVDAVSNPHDGGSNGGGIYGPGNRTPLYRAFQHNEHALEVVKLLLAHGAKVTVTDQAQQTPLHEAATLGNKAIVELLLAHKAPINALDNFGESPLYNAVRSGSVETVQLLLSKGAHLVIKEADEPILHIAVSGEPKIQMVQVLLKAGASPDALNAFGQTVLYKACAADNIECVKLLLKHNVDVNMKNEDETLPLMVAVENNNRALVKLLLEVGAQVRAANSKGKTVLHFSDSADLEVTKLLLQYGADVNACDCEGNTPLFRLCDAYGKHLSTIKLLIEHGADVNARRSSDGATLLSLAARWQDEQVVEFLLKQGVAVTTKDDCGLTPLHYAGLRFSKSKDIIKKLLLFGADIDERTNTGQTALHLALEKNYIKTALTLIEFGATIHAVDTNGKTPLDLTYPEEAKYILGCLNK